jgi:hypothetical protein
LIRQLRDISDKTELNVKWFFENDDEDMEEAGDEFKVLFKDIEFNVIGVEQL